ncbi:MAG: GNAT family N-acetyltransferase [Bacteroidota bacterium]
MENFRIVNVAFYSLKDEHFNALDDIYNTVGPNTELKSYYDKLYYPKLEYSKVLTGNLGRVFFVKDERNEEYVGFLLVFDNVNFKKKGFHQEQLGKYLEHEASFIQEMAIIGKFAFINQLIIHSDYRKKGLAKYLLAEMEQYYTFRKMKERSQNGVKNRTIGSKAVIIGSVVHEKNYPTLMLLKGKEFAFIDFYRSGFDAEGSDEPPVSTLWYRVVKVMDASTFYKRINSDLLPQTFKTIIPIQLNSASRNINKLIGRLNAKILWSSFFQFDQNLIKFFGMDRLFIGYYDTLLESPREQFDMVVKTMNHLHDYRESSDGYSFSSVIRQLEKYSSNLFLLDAEFDGFASFASPEVISIDSVRKSGKYFNIKKESYIDEEHWSKLFRLYEHLHRTDISVKSREKEWYWCHAIIPISFADGLKGVLFSFVVDKATADRDMNIIDELAYTISNAFTKNLSNIILKLKDRIQKSYVTRSRVGHIIMRNMSHNIGSHVLSRVSSLQTLSQFINENAELYGAQEVAIFNAYLRTRMNLLADLMYVTPATTVSRKLKEELVSKFNKEKIVLNYISGTSWQKDNIVISYEGPDYWVQIPNGNLGNHAFFMVLENIIRNCAKHGVRDRDPVDKPEELEEDYLELHISCQPSKRYPAYFKVTIHDNIQRTLPFFLRKPLKYDEQPKLERLLNIHRLNRPADKLYKIEFLLHPANLTSLIDLIKYKKLIDLKDLLEREELEKVKERFVTDQKENEYLRTLVHPESMEKYEGYFNKKRYARVRRIIKYLEQLRLENLIEPNGKLKMLNLFKFVHALGFKPKEKLLQLYSAIKDVDIANEIQNNHIDQILEKDDPGRIKGAGVTEMKIAAAYLRKVPMSNINETYDPLLLRAFRKNGPGKNQYCLGYELYLEKPRSVVIVDPDNILRKEQQLEKLELAGISIANSKTLQSNQTSYPSELVLFLSKIPRKEIEKTRIFPLRWIHLDSKEQQQKLSELLDGDMEKLLLHYWELWFERYMHNKEDDHKNYELLLHYDSPEYDEQIKQRPLAEWLIYNHHASLAEDPSFDPEQCGFYEGYGSTSPTGLMLLHRDGETEMMGKYLDIQYMEAACTRIVVLDERIQQEAAQQAAYLPGQQADYIDELRWMKINVPRPEQIDLHKNIYSEADKQNIVEWIRREIKNPDTDFFIIHLGIIEKIVGTKDEDIEKFIDSNMRDINIRPEIVLISGRGTPRYVPKTVLFVHYSNIAQYILEEKSKFHLCKILFAARNIPK